MSNSAADGPDAPRAGRVVVTGTNEAGHSTVADDRSLTVDTGRTGAVLLHAIDGPASLPVTPAPPARRSPVPVTGGSTFVLLVIPPGDRAAQPQIPLHRTNTVDYGIVLTGAVTLELGDGSSTTLQAGDAVVQAATDHAWRNERDEPCVMAFCLLGLPEDDAGA